MTSHHVIKTLKRRLKYSNHVIKSDISKVFSCKDIDFNGRHIVIVSLPAYTIKL
jgi:hypothetical protein